MHVSRRFLRSGLLACLIVVLTSTAPWAAADGESEPVSTPADSEFRRQMAGWLEDIRADAGHARDFVLDQAPLVVRDLVAMGRAESTIWLVGWVVSLAFAFWSLRRTVRLIHAKWDDDEIPEFVAFFYCFAAMGSLVWAFISLIGIVCWLHDFVTSWFAPRIYVIEYVADMIGVMHGGK